MGTMGYSRIKKFGRNLSSNMARAGAGFASRLRTPFHVVLVGLNGSGKTTILLQLRFGRYSNTTPTVAFNCEKLWYGGASWSIWDVGGAERLRPLWRPYTRDTDALIFVVDGCSNSDRLDETRVELQRLLKQQAVRCSVMGRNKPPLLLLANKQDLPSAKSLDVLTHALGMQDLPPSQPWVAASCCAVTGEGLEPAMLSLKKLLVSCRQKHKSRFVRWLNWCSFVLNRTITGKSSAPFSLGGDNLKRYFDQR